ncbi:hypothetical protein SAMN05421665_2201 [Yoonia rosea]|uniref:HIRAN domain-containing protein n=1 Tax=Yoonia rosea TaxID=287098 RepID=A0A1R3X6G4_9RHOB|nr:hypothetical protein [Yoonia rosea]SIT86022.1 hypothetical protein SAMN05421665_2201 [Yoonia rosea]
MSLLGRLLGRKKKEFTASFTLAHTRGFQQKVVGEASYQNAISNIVGGKSERSAKYECIAVLVPDDVNPYDANAVEVRINGLLVGYLPKTDATKYRDELKALDPSLPIAAARAKIVGGWIDEESEGHFGVKLNLKWPLTPT